MLVTWLNNRSCDLRMINGRSTSYNLLLTDVHAYSVCVCVCVCVFNVHVCVFNVHVCVCVFNVHVC